MKIKKNLLLLLSAIFSLSCLADCADCEAYKTQVINDCDSIVSSCDSAYFDCISAAGAAEQFAVYYASNSTESVALTQAAEAAYRAAGTITTLKVFAQSIKSTALTLQCSTNSASGICDCAQYLQNLSQQLTTIHNDIVSQCSIISSISSAVGTSNGNNLLTLVNSLETTNQDLDDILTQFFSWDGESIPINISDFYQASSNLVYLIKFLVSGNTLTQAEKSALGLKYATVSDSVSTWNTTYKSMSYTFGNAANQNTFAPFDSTANLRSYSLGPTIKMGFENLIARLSSLNNYSFTNLFLFSSIHDKMFDISQGVSQLTNQFSIFIEASAGASPVLSAYTSQDGSYHDYLTNYYIQVSGDTVSGSTPLTNWFNRIEMLLAALVFQDDDGPNTNAVPSSSSYDQVEDSLNQTFTSINQQGQDFISTVDTSGKSILSMLREWNSAVSGVAKPSAFTIAEIPNSFSSGEPVRRDGSSEDLNLTLDTDNELFSGFVELVRGVTTLSWITLFLVVGYFLSIRIITLIGKLISFGYSVYSAIFGGG